MAKPRRTQILNAQAVTASGNSGVVANQSRMLNPVVVMLIDITAVSGTTPSIAFGLYSVLPDNSIVLIAAATAMTAFGQQRMVFQNVIEPNVQVNWTVSGTTPSFTCNVDLFFTSPDA
jgi:hypothetical protein